MFIRIRSKWDGQHWRVRLFMAPSRELSPQLKGTLTLNHLEWLHFKMLLAPSIEVIEEKEN